VPALGNMFVDVAVSFYANPTEQANPFNLSHKKQQKIITDHSLIYHQHY